MSKFKIKESYLLLLIVLGLVSLGIYTTYALFTASTTINDVVGITATLDIGKSMSEYEVITIQPEETKLIELNVVNSYNDNVYYGAWYKIVQGNSDDIQIGLYTEKNPNPSTGSLASSSNIKLLVGIINDNTTPIVVYLGVKGSLTNELNLGSDKTLLPNDFAEALLVTDEVLESKKVIIEQAVNNSYEATGEVQNVTLNPGTYKLEVWGAQGGSYSNTYAGGKGGYSYGTLTLTDETNLFVYVGKQGTGTGTSTTGLVSGGFNGGGNGYSSSTTYLSSAGGGASDIRIREDSLYSRVIVAGGGGGAGSYSSNSTRHYSGGVGGGESGTAGGQYSTSYKGGLGGSQTTAGTSYYGTTVNSTNSSYGTVASFGIGASGKSSSGVAGGGGGWYGGGYGRRAVGGGESGYVYTSSTASNYPSGNLLTSTYYLTDAATLAGNTSFTDFDGTTVTGHVGDGKAKITGTSKIVSYTIPHLTGLTDLVVQLGTNRSLTEGTTLICENNTTTGCLITKISITDTSTLTIGTYVATYTVKGNDNKKYLFNRNIIVINDPVQATLTLLNLTETTGTPDFSKTSCSEGCGESTVGLYQSEDDLGTSYYFRGDVTNNYVYFAGFYWRIIRINGDGSIRMIYAGTTAHPNGYSDSGTSDMRIGTSAFNENYNDNAYVGYMYGTPGSSTYEATHANTNNSTIKTAIDSWYNANIKDTEYEQYVVDTIYCNDRELQSGTGVGKTKSYYKARERLYSNKIPSLKCTQENDRFTVNSKVSEVTGNGALTYPIGIITADEVAYAGGTYSTGNSKYYLYTNYVYWTMSLSDFVDSLAYGFSISNLGVFSNSSVRSINSVRPVISILGTSLTSGTGSMIDPFKINS